MISWKRKEWIEKRVRFPENNDFEEDRKDSNIEVKEFSKIEELSGSLDIQYVDDKLMHSVIENDKQVVEEGKIIEESTNRGMGGFTPDLAFENMVKNYSMTKKIMGPSLIKFLTGYDADYIEKNIGVPEFQKELLDKMKEKAQQMRNKNLMRKDGSFTDKGLELASLVVYIKQLDNLFPKGIQGERIHKKAAQYGDKEYAKPYHKGDRYKDLAIKKSIKTAIRRGHDKLLVEDFKTYDRKSKGEVSIVFALDSSGSMKGDKIGTCKRAGVALAYNAIKEKDKVGLIVFGKEITTEIPPTKDFSTLLKAITGITASSETDLALMLRKAIELFPPGNITKHLLILTDALPTRGDSPEEKALDAVAIAKAAGITISLIGIRLDKKGKEFAERMTDIGQGKLYSVRDLDDIGTLVLEDYYDVR